MGLGGILLLVMSIWRPRHGSSHQGSGMGGCFRYHHSTVGIFSGYTVAGTAIIALSSTVLAGIRRATGLTLRRQLCWPAINVQSGERWLAWCNARIAQINEEAERHVTKTVAKFGSDIEDPMIRELWERQLRADLKERVKRMHSRIRCVEEMVEQAREVERNPSKRKKMHPPLLAAYLWVGERIFDWLVSWMKRNPHFCVDSGFVTGQEAAEPAALTLFDDAVPNIDDAEMSVAAGGLAPASMPMIGSLSAQEHHEVWYGRGRSPPDDIPEPSAPQLNEKDTSASNAVAATSSSAHINQAHASVNARYSRPVRSMYAQDVEPCEPPPYTPVENDEPELVFMN
ncbi:hypothetical protein DL89DRAFT_270427 [Linderina pennispora]|uniref:Uncharacterized protein n=1 Tax=Linderina pennispora TaxID=61395 RepID=A0A1Y1VYE1_9FUNG|nr:uncharacterized protein DL89DRAFT_270427 [Linderina pennispora]ORX66036.1 hypothetical protein DL89DRAFT_270427 [Linderina pennispora]